MVSSVLCASELEDRRDVSAGGTLGSTGPLTKKKVINEFVKIGCRTYTYKKMADQPLWSDAKMHSGYSLA